MKLISVPIAAAAALALSLPAPAFAQSSDAPGLGAAAARAQQTMVDRANSLPVVADPKAVGTRSRLGSYPTRKGVILVTPDKYGIFNVGHAAIIFEDGKLTESVSDGVKWSENNWREKTQVYGVAPHATSRAQDAAASTWASHQRGKPYNWVFTDVNTRSKFYCSQLVWAAFKDNFGVNLNRPDVMGDVVYPMELVTNGKVYLLYRQK